MKTRNIAVLFGGCSSEYGVSLASAQAVIRAVDTDRYTPVLIGISQAGDFYYYTGTVAQIGSDTWCNPQDCTPAAVSPDRSHPSLLVLGAGGVTRIPLDAAFPVLHGQNGEDGTVQGLFELAGIPVVGCGVLASALCMDKDRAHKLVKAAGVRVPESFVLDRLPQDATALDMAARLGYPLFVKPVRAGSSYGVTRVTGPEDLPAAVRLAFSYDGQVLLEEAITGFEVGCAVLGNDVLSVGEVDEIELGDGFFDFKEKYTLETAAIHVPARISKELAQAVQGTAKLIYRVLGCTGFARVDLFLDHTGALVFNEVNTIPGFTDHSRYPSMMRAAGRSFTEIVAAVIALAVDP